MAGLMALSDATVGVLAILGLVGLLLNALIMVWDRGFHSVFNNPGFWFGTIFCVLLVGSPLSLFVTGATTIIWMIVLMRIIDIRRHK